MPRLITAFLFITSLISSIWWNPSPASIAVNDWKVDYRFGEQAVFHASIQYDSPIQSAFLSYQSEGDQVQVQPVEISKTGEINAALALRPGVLRPFSTVSYWFSLTPQKGEVFTSPKYTFFYEDNRFKWQTLKSSLFVVHWIDGDLGFAQAAQNVAETGLKAIQNVIPVDQPDKAVDIYIYVHAADLQSASDLGGFSWVAGSAEPDLGVVLVSIPPGPDQKLVMDQQVPHELAHVITYQYTGPGYDKLPAWLAEGIASLAELNPNGDYAYALEVAKKDGTLIPMQDLCQAIPRDASRAFLAYAQADSFSRYLLTTYGTPGMLKLVQSYLDGLGCSEGAQASFGLPLNVLEYKWKQNTLQIDTIGLVMQKSLPYLFLIAIIIAIPLISFVFARSSTKRRSDGEKAAPTTTH
jgi:hypothetical protein